MTHLDIATAFVREADARLVWLEDGYVSVVDGHVVFAQDAAGWLFAHEVGAVDQDVADRLAARVREAGRIDEAHWACVGAAYGSEAWLEDQDGGQGARDDADDYEASFAPPPRYALGVG